MKKIAFVFKSLPHTTAKGREGLDALLAASAYSEDISVFFLGEGVAQLINNQQPDLIYSRNYINTFKLLELYDIEDIYVCQSSLDAMGLHSSALIMDVTLQTKSDITARLRECDSILTF
ncbi:sulfurtransferase TusC [Vibrio sp. 10N.286.49.B3]|uniref:sulfurtransferase complex subunit TusC n=1 Tax=Vibrio sp. 10N.286.49.B3 TaxID=1880855 RepID=UPI000C82EC33|nr:sulfurtransferase complex subunit TusC [Vibrio sp. 10N.286.49.B3]PMH46310.1 sulfurtransferase TusC [Vibrio sp. 10N.286.49.B3]